MTHPRRSDTDSSRPQRPGRSSVPARPSRPPSRRPSERPGRRGRTSPLAAALTWGVVSIAALAVAVATFLFIATPTDLLRDKIVQEVREQTGRDLSVAGGASLRLYPSIGLTLRDVVLSAPPGMAGGPMARVEELEIETPLRQLLVGELKVERVVLRKPELNLRVDADGRRNWVFDRPARGAGGSGLDAGGSTAPSRFAMLAAIPVANVRIEDGKLHYADARRDLRETINGLNLEASVPSLTDRLEAQGSFVLRDQRVEFRSSLDSLATLLSGAASQLAIQLSSDPAEVNYDGTIATASGTRLEGELEVKASSLRALAAWFDTSLPAEEDGPVILRGQLETSAKSVSLSGISGTIADRTIKGAAALETGSGPRPRLDAELKISALDLTPWLRPGGQRSAASSDLHSDSTDIPDDAPRATDDSLRGTQTDGTQVRGFIARHGWSDVPFELDGLGELDAVVSLVADRLTYRDIRAGTTHITAILADRVLNATIDRMQLYDGTATGTIRLNGAETVPVLQANLRLDDVSALDLLRDAAEFDWIDGKGRVALTLEGKGRSEKEFVETLNGGAEFAFRDGALVGLDIPGMITALQRGRLPQLERNAADRTSFSELAASFTIRNGIAENRDLRIVSSLVRATGSGTADLPRRTLDYTLRPKLVASPADGQGKAAAELELPIRITGSWDRPVYTADLETVLKNPNDVVEAVKEIGKQLKGKDLEQTLQNLLSDDEGDGGGKKRKAKDLLRQFLRP